MTDETVQSRRISADRFDGEWLFGLTSACIDELREWMQAQGIDPVGTASITYDVVDMPLVRAAQYVRDENGNICLAPDDPHRPHIVDVDYPIRSALPDWWTPR